MTQSNITYSAHFKARMVFTLLRGKHTVEELSRIKKIPTETLIEWKEYFIKNAARIYRYAVFSQNKDKNIEDEYMVRISELRKQNGYTQKEIGDLLGTSQNMYARYENGKSQLPIRHLIKLIHFYGVSADYILGMVEQ